MSHLSHSLVFITTYIFSIDYTLDISLATLIIIIIILINNIFDNNIIISEYNLTKLSNLSTMTYEYYNNNNYIDKLKDSLLGIEAIDKIL